MAEEIACPTCETPNDPWSELCEACGAELHAEVPVQDVVADGDALVEPDADAQSGDFEDFDEVQAYAEADPDDGAEPAFAPEGDGDPSDVTAEADDEFDAAFEHGDEGLAEDTGPDEEPFSPEASAAPEEMVQGDDPAPFAAEADLEGQSADEQQGEPEDVAYELEVIEPDGDQPDNDPESDPESDQWAGEDTPAAGQRFDADAASEAPSDASFQDWGDQVAADGGAPIEAPLDEQTDQPYAELAPESDADLEDQLAADSEPESGDEFNADSDVDFDEFAAASDPEDERFEATTDSEVEEVSQEPPPPPELEEILNPQQVDRAPIEPLPTPGNYAEPATLTVFRGGEELGEVAIDFDCTVLGLDSSDGTEEADASQAEVSAEDDFEQEYELEAIEPVEADADEAAAEKLVYEEDSYELEAIEDEPDEAFELDEVSEEAFEQESDESFELDEDSDWGDDEDAYADSEVDEEPEAASTYEDPDDLEEGPVIDLGQFGDEARFARRHGYLFRQNKHYTLYVLSDMGTQINDELLELGEYRELSDGDVIILGGEVALKFNKPAA